MQQSKSWQVKCQERLQAFADACFNNWCQSPEGKKWKQRSKKCSPYSAGFSLPDFHHELIKALGRNDEVTAKSIMLDYYV